MQQTRTLRFPEGPGGYLRTVNCAALGRSLLLKEVRTIGMAQRDIAVQMESSERLALSLTWHHPSDLARLAALNAGDLEAPQLSFPARVPPPSPDAFKPFTRLTNLRHLAIHDGGSALADDALVCLRELHEVVGSVPVKMATCLIPFQLPCS